MAKKVLRFLIFGLLFLLIGRLFYLTIVLRGKYQTMAEENRLVMEEIPPPRGIIFDRDREPLAIDSPQYFRREMVISREEYLKSKINNQETRLVYRRYYPLGPSFAHLLGYLGPVSKEELKGNKDCGSYSPDDWRGRGGVEEEYECWLRGEAGKRLVETDIKGNNLREIGRQEAKPGKDLVLAISSKLQKKAASLLGEKRGAIVVTNPQNGEVLALVSSPSFDPNLFTYKRDEGRIEALLDDSRNPFLNRAISARFPPGSIFKLVTAVAALEEGVIDGQTKIEDTGVIEVGNFRYANWYFLQYGKKEGAIDLITAIKRSNDVFFYRVGEKLGAEKLSFWAKNFNLDRQTGIDLPAEVAGLVPSPQWKKETKGEDWFLGNTYHFAIGQGDLALTPLQVNTMTNVFANGGNLCVPHVVMEKEGEPPVEKKCSPLSLKKENLDLVVEGMREACSPALSADGVGGTAYPFFDFKVRGEENKVACKTGTAEMGEESTHAWFAVFAPVDKPEISVTVFLEEGGEGSKQAAPIAREILAEYFGEK
ncbi:hypothetical protein KBI33_00370 [Candidatus Shapirobacteria bacterium]|nr:hypothetical protein [Candidatus Shapirobacteria bacterium]